MGGFEQALGNTQHHVFPVDGLGDVNTFLLIGAGVLVLSIMSMVVYKCMNKDHPTSNLAMGLGAVLTVLVGGSATTIALSPTLLAGNTVWLGVGVGAFVLVAIVFAALTTSWNTGANDFKKRSGCLHWLDSNSSCDSNRWSHVCYERAGSDMGQNVDESTLLVRSWIGFNWNRFIRYLVRDALHRKKRQLL